MKSRCWQKISWPKGAITYIRRTYYPGLSACDNLGVESPKSVTHIDDMVVNVTSVPHYDVTNIGNVTNMSDVNHLT